MILQKFHFHCNEVEPESNFVWLKSRENIMPHSLFASEIFLIETLKVLFNNQDNRFTRPGKSVWGSGELFFMISTQNMMRIISVSACLCLSNLNVASWIPEITSTPLLSLSLLYSVYNSAAWILAPQTERERK